MMISLPEPSSVNKTRNNRKKWKSKEKEEERKVMDSTSAPNNVVPPERVQDMRKAIHSYLQQSNTYSQIREIIDTYAADNESFNSKDPSDVLRVLQERGLVQQILQRMQYQNASVSGKGAVAAARSRNLLQGLKPNEKYLHVRLVGGRAFIDNLDADIHTQRTTQMVVCMQYAGQRFRSTPQEATVDPCFDDDFLVHLDHGHSDLIDLATPLNISVVKEECSLGRCRLIGENTIEWRKVLVTGFMSLTVELCGANPSVPTGVVELEVELIPGGPKVPSEDILNRIAAQRSAVIAADREFLIYARRWWNDYHSIRASHRQRHVKVFAATVSGRMVPVTHYVSIIGPDRSLETPAMAARFVSLFTLQRREDTTADLLGGGASQGTASTAAGAVWASPFAFLTQKHGEVCNHATLLCSLFLGFGLDAYCVVGTEGSDAASHMWVLTRKRIAGNAYEVTYWEPTTGERFAVNGPHQYQTVGCVFNHICFYANTQDSDNAITCYFDLEDEVQWSPLNQLKLRMVPKFPNPSLLYIPMNTRLMEIELEGSLKQLVKDHRDTLGLQTHWDESLAAVSSQALVGYEEQRTKGTDTTNPQAIDFGTFHSCVKGVIGEGRTFKGFPLNVSHIGEHKILSLLQAAAAGREVLQLNADDLKHALRVRIFSFPEGVVSVWIMFAARYRPLP